MTGTSTATAYLETAAQIGHEIVAEAIWHEERCTWVGAMPEEGFNGQMALTYATFGPELYGGSAGVGLVLAELHHATEEASFGLAAVASLEHSFARANEVVPALRLGLYSGVLGVGIAATRVASLIDHPSLASRAAALARSVDPTDEVVENDLLGGRAGAILGFLALNDALGDDAFLELAVRTGDALLSAAVNHGEALTWFSPLFPGQRPLTGLAHGAAGIGLALLELWYAAGERRHLDAAERAFAYERELYDPHVRNWPDLRESVRRSQPSAESPSYATFWCHGAPGIALSRIRAFELTLDERYRTEAVRALETTLHSVEAELRTGNYSLCHGLAGNAEVLIEGRHLIGEQAEEVSSAVAAAGIDNYGLGHAPWPSGIFGGRTASLFLGLAGTAYFYLRLHDPTVPSLLGLGSRSPQRH